ncbi:MAG TPA: hypothetical protein VKR27_01330, partial [Acidimicrobiales bacterium]|nr:hypothetical protein [Acidimicrobiales bacterium]
WRERYGQGSPRRLSWVAATSRAWRRRIARLMRGARRSESAPRASAAYAESVFFHYNALFDAEAVIRRHARVDLEPNARYLTNFLGVVIDPKWVPQILAGREGQLEPIPIPANWHADIAEWAGALRAVDLARRSFTMAELGCGWGCWMNNAGVAARNAGLSVHLIGVEADEGHLAFAREACQANDFAEGEFTLHRGIAGASSGFALFPRQETAGEQWGLEPIFDVAPADRDKLLATGAYEELRVFGLGELIGDQTSLDLLHVDIQGGEADLIEASRRVLDERVAYLLVGTHSRQIEGRLFECLSRAGWRLEIERPAIITLTESGPVTSVDGVQGWRNLARARN